MKQWPSIYMRKPFEHSQASKITLCYIFAMMISPEMIPEKYHFKFVKCHKGLGQVCWIFGMPTKNSYDWWICDTKQSNILLCYKNSTSAKVDYEPWPSRLWLTDKGYFVGVGTLKNDSSYKLMVITPLHYFRWGRLNL